jgi:hypothetical protein
MMPKSRFTAPAPTLRLYEEYTRSLEHAGTSKLDTQWQTTHVAALGVRLIGAASSLAPDRPTIPHDSPPSPRAIIEPSTPPPSHARLPNVHVFRPPLAPLESFFPLGSRALRRTRAADEGLSADVVDLASSRRRRNVLVAPCRRLS